MQENHLGQVGGWKASGKAKPQMDGWSDERCREVWESGTGGLKPRTEMVGGVFLSWPRPYMCSSAWESVSQRWGKDEFCDKNV